MQAGIELAIARVVEGPDARAENRRALVECVDGMELPLADELRTKLRQPDSDPAELRDALWEALCEGRRRLGSDRLRAPLFMLLNGLLHELVSRRTGVVEDTRFKPLALPYPFHELGIAADPEAIEGLLAAEAARLGKSPDSDLAAALREAADRIRADLLARWDLAQRRRIAGISTSLAEAPKGPRATCFVSYATSDKPFCDRLYELMVSEGYRVWYAPSDGAIGEHLARQIEQSIRDCDAMILVLSRHSFDRPWVRFEIDAALQERRRLVPIRLVPEDRSYFWSFLKDESDPAQEVRRQGLIDFSRWEDEDALREAFARLSAAIDAVGDESELLA